MPPAGDEPKRKGIGGSTVTWTHLIAVVTTLSALIGAIKTLATETSGAQVAPGRVLFFIGATALLLYFSAGAGAMFGAGAVAAVISAFHIEETATVEQIIIGAGVVVAGAMAVLLISAGVLYDYDGTDTIGRVFVALVGLAALGVPVWLKVRENSN